MHIELLLEEPSAEALFTTFFQKLVPEGTTWKTIPFQGKHDLLNNLERRLKGYSRWLPDDWRIVVLLDEDREDCHALKRKMEAAARAAGLTTKSASRGSRFVVLNRIVVEELEAWYFGDPDALVAAFPGVSATIGSKAAFRDPDAIDGGTWEALERVLQRAGYYRSGIAKIEVARTMAEHLDPSRNSSASFRQFLDGLAALS